MNDYTTLKNLLQSMNSKDFEHMVAALIGKLLGVHIAVAKSGFQHGADSGTSGRQERYLRIECKCYSDKTSLSDRELKGELDDASLRDEALEVWVLAATRDIPEQLEQSLSLHGNSLGIPVIFVGWRDKQPPVLAALCASSPELVGKWLPKAISLLQSLQGRTADLLTQLQRDLQTWSLGFKTTHQQSLDWSNAIWNNKNNAQARFHQNVAGGVTAHKIRRQAVHQQLGEWWQSGEAIAAVIGLEGVGKTWAVFDWLIDQQAYLPIILTIPSSRAARFNAVSINLFKQFLAEELHNITGVRGVELWNMRANRLLKRPAEEGPVFLVFFDGLNQEPAVKWRELCQLMQDECFCGKVRLIVSSRPQYFDEELRGLNSLNPQRIEVGNYCLSDGGEFDQMLRMEQLSRDDLHPDLVKLAQNPRLFKIVMLLRERLQNVESITLHRLLWEYGRDTCETRAHNNSFSEIEWCDWLQRLAEDWRKGCSHNRKQLSESIARSDLEPQDISRRLSDLIDNRFVNAKWQPEPMLVEHALGLALGEVLNVRSGCFDQANTLLTDWLDPLSGLDQRAEILRAAVSICLERADASSFVLDVLTTAWLQTQNLAGNHRQEVKRLAPELTSSLLTALEYSLGYAQESARLLAVNALRTIQRDNHQAAGIIIARVDTWFSMVFHAVNLWNDATMEQKRIQKMIDRVGRDQDGPIIVAGVNLTLTTQDFGMLQQLSPSILEGFSLAPTVPIFAKAAANLAIMDHPGCWDSLKWLCLFNDNDYEKTTQQIRTLATAIAKHTAGSGVSTLLPTRIASLLLRLTGKSLDEVLADQINYHWQKKLSYQKDYLESPAKSSYATEYRHAKLVMADVEINPVRICKKLNKYWAAPHLVMTSVFSMLLTKYAQSTDVTKLGRSRQVTPLDHSFKFLEVPLARSNPAFLAQMMRDKLVSMPSCDEDSAYIFSFHFTDHLLLAKQSVIAKVAKQLRQNLLINNESERHFAKFHLAIIELLLETKIEQYKFIIESDFPIYNELIDLLEPLNRDEIDGLISQYQSGTNLQHKNLLLLLSAFKYKFDDFTWEWIVSFASAQDRDMVNVVFRTLYLSDAAKFGHTLLQKQWSWSADQDNWTNYYGSLALIEGSLDRPFTELCDKIAPWLLLEAVKYRNNNLEELQQVIKIYDCILNIKVAEYDLIPDAEVSINISQNRVRPHCFSATPLPQLETNNLEAFFKEIKEPSYNWYLRQQAALENLLTTQQKAYAKKVYFLNEIFNVSNFSLLVQNNFDVVQRWINGYIECSYDFQQRVRLTEGFYLGLCECLLTAHPKIGVRLWKSLYPLVRTHVVGVAEISEWLHIIFRTANSEALYDLREEIFELHYCNTDEMLFNLALAAQCNGKTSALEQLIAKDQKSNQTWKQRRALVLRGFMINSQLPKEEEWPIGPIVTSEQQILHYTKPWQFRDAFAQYWWQKYWRANTAEDAYAAWIVFMETADRRALLWIDQTINNANDNNELFQLKHKHFHINRSQLKNRMKEQEKDLDKQFLFQKTVTGIRPWH